MRSKRVWEERERGGMGAGGTTGASRINTGGIGGVMGMRGIGRFQIDGNR